MSPRCNTLPRATMASPFRYNTMNSLKDSAASSTSTTPTATPLAPRRSSFTHAQQFKGIPRRSSLSRASPSPVRRRTMTPGRVVGVGKAPPPASYALSLPRTLYGDDINGNSNMMMTQSMDPAHLAARLDNNTTPMVLAQRESLQVQELMTTSLDPSMLAGYNPANIQVWDFHYSRVFALWSKVVILSCRRRGCPRHGQRIPPRH